MLYTKILVPLARSGKDLNSVHYALSLAKRLRARVYILQQAAGQGSETSMANWMDEALLDLINSARQAGLSVSHHIARTEMTQEVVGLVMAEGIDLLIVSDDDGVGTGLLHHVKPLIQSQIIQVKEKDHVNYL